MRRLRKIEEYKHRITYNHNYDYSFGNDNNERCKRVRKSKTFVLQKLEFIVIDK